MEFYHECENCEKRELLSSEQAFQQGWDYPPRMGEWGVVSPRTCGDCGIETTVWWELALNETNANNLSQKHKKTLKRIIAEPFEDPGYTPPSAL